VPRVNNLGSRLDREQKRVEITITQQVIKFGIGYFNK